MSSFVPAMITAFKQMGLTDFLLPFLLFFAIIYATLEKTQVFGEDRRDIDAIIAFAIGLIAAMTSWVVKAISGFLPWIAFIMVVIVGLLMAVALVFGDITKFNSEFKWFGKAAVVIISLVLIAAAITSIPGMSGVGSGVNISISPEDTAMIVILVFVIAFFAVITRKPKNSSGGN